MYRMFSVGNLSWNSATLSAGFRGEPKGPGNRAAHQKGHPTMFIYLAICACHLNLFIEESLFFGVINCRSGRRQDIT